MRLTASKSALEQNLFAYLRTVASDAPQAGTPTNMALRGCLPVGHPARQSPAGQSGPSAPGRPKGGRRLESIQVARVQAGGAVVAVLRAGQECVGGYKAVAVLAGKIRVVVKLKLHGYPSSLSRR